MRPDIDPGQGELAVLALIAIACWLVWAWKGTRSQP
jgi:hypothetical protein